MPADAVYFTAPGAVEVREDPVGEPGPGELAVEALVSAISPGTELLLYRGEMDADRAADETLDSLSGSFSYPFPYGYAVVGEVTAVGDGVDPAWDGETVLAFHPHAAEFVVSVDEVSAIPDGVTPEEAVFLPNVETAVNLTLDGEPTVGERVVVVGQGVVGLLTTAVLSSFPLDELVTVERLPTRRRLSTAMGADRSLAPEEDPVAAVREWPPVHPAAPPCRERSSDTGTERSGETGEERSADGGTEQPGETGEERPGDTGNERSGERPPDRADLAYELTGDPAALDTAIEATGYGGRVVVGSWYGEKRAELSLDGRFHRSRIEIRSSQVSTLAPERRGRWTVDRRLATAWRRLREIETDRLVTHRIPVDRAPEAYRLLDERPNEAVQVLLTY